MPTVSAADLAVLAEALTNATTETAKTATALDRLIAAEGRKIGDKFGLQYAKTAREQIEEKDFELQRQGDLVAELRRQLAVAGRYADRFITIRKVVEDASRSGSRSVGISYLLDLVKTLATPDDKENGT